jgi:membrane-bound lytic murein transglycosylase MltF
MKVTTAAIALCLLCIPAAQAQDASASDPVTLLLPPMLRNPFTGDLPQIRKRGVLRALVTPSRTDFFLDGARPRGIFVELLEPYRKSLNKGLKRRDLQVVIKYVIVPFSDLIPALLEGRGDIAVANLTITPEREEKVAFAHGKESRVDELLVVHKDVTGIDSLDDLAGRTVQVLAGSSYATHLRALSERLVAHGAAPINVVEADPLLVTEDLLELANAGVVAVTVADDYRARLWAKVLPDIVVREDVKVNTGGTLGWAVRKENPLLLKSVQAIVAKVRTGSLIGNTLINRYYGRTKWIKNPTSEKEQRKLKRLIALFKRYGEQYGFDWVALAAQGYQESTLDHRAKSRAGAVGVMQLLPSTAKDKNVGIPDISSIENNIHAGVKYLAFLRERYFSGPALSEEDRLAFSWAAYNAGPAKVRRMRAKTRKLGLDPDRWFGNVEHGALAIVGQETVRYVRNIYKYYVTYKALLERGEAHADKARAARSKSD